MKDSKDTKKTRNITFRLTEEEYAQVEKFVGGGRPKQLVQEGSD